MKKFLRIAAITLAGIVLLLVVVGLLLPREWHVEQSIVIDAPPETVHPYVENFRNWPDWAGWNDALDPTLRREYEGPESGVGAVQRWQGEKMGRGELTITKSDPQAGVWYDGKIETDEVNAHGSITYEPAAEGTRVIWTDTGQLPPIIGGYFAGFVETALADHFQTGLERLKTLAEQELPGP